MSILLTGADGFIGHRLKYFFNNDTIYTVVKNKSNLSPYSIGLTYDSETRWDKLLCDKKIETIVHLGCIAHKTKFNHSEVYDVNVLATLNLAKFALDTGVKKFIFLSSLSVVEYNEKGCKTDSNSLTSLKLKAEALLIDLFEGSKTELVIIRSPLCYGPGVKANFQTLMKVSDWFFILPFRNAIQKGSFIYLDNLCSFIRSIVYCKKSLPVILYVSDNDNLSISDLLNKISNSMSKKLILFSMPLPILKFVFLILGKKNIFNVLFTPNSIDIKGSMDILNWYPPVDVDTAINKTVLNYLSDK